MKRTFPLLRALLRDERGTITIEFLLWMPVLAFWLVVSALYFEAYKSRSDAMKAAHTLTDIMSRQVEVTDAFIAELYALQRRLVSRAPAGTRLRISSVQYSETDEEYQVLWSRAIGGDEPLTTEMISQRFFPEMADLDTVILTELSVPYHPFTSWAGIGQRTWSFALFTRPRFVSQVAILD
jgi:hypothetical protein